MRGPLVGGAVLFGVVLCWLSLSLFVVARLVLLSNLSVFVDALLERAVLKQGVVEVSSQSGLSCQMYAYGTDRDSLYRWQASSD